MGQETASQESESRRFARFSQELNLSYGWLMNQTTKSETGIPKAWRWLMWTVFVVLWTTALLTTEPVHVAHAVLAPRVVLPTAKLLHVSAYAFVAVLSGWLIVPPRWRWLLLVFMCVHAFGTEFFQQFVPERGPSLWDVGIDHVGIAIGLTISCKWWLKSDRLDSTDESSP
jgi:VanZ family protein